MTHNLACFQPPLPFIVHLRPFKSLFAARCEPPQFAAVGDGGLCRLRRRSSVPLPPPLHRHHLPPPFAATIRFHCRRLCTATICRHHSVPLPSALTQGVAGANPPSSSVEWDASLRMAILSILSEDSFGQFFSPPVTMILVAAGQDYQSESDGKPQEFVSNYSIGYPNL